MHDLTFCDRTCQNESLVGQTALAFYCIVLTNYRSHSYEHNDTPKSATVTVYPQRQRFECQTCEMFGFEINEFKYAHSVHAENVVLIS